MTEQTIAHPTGEAASQAQKIATLAVCFTIVTLDGLDTTSIAFVAPVLSRAWNLTPAAFTPAFVATSVGAVIGYMLSGPVAARWGKRQAALWSVLIFGFGTLATVLAHDIVTISIIRLITAIGLGGCLPIAVAAGADIMPPRYKETAAMLVATGLSAGSVIGGLIALPLIRDHGWTSIFIIGGIAPLLILPLFIWVLPKEAQGAKAGNPVAALFGDGLATSTILLWTFAFLVFIDAYALMFWIPTLLVDFGFEPALAPLATAAFGTGGLVGNVILMLLVARFGIKALLIAISVFAIACIVALSKGATPSMVLPLIAGLGAGFICCCVGQAALAVSLYPSALRTTGVGWASAAGRVGSIFGPALGGLMMSLGWAPRDIILTAILPATVRPLRVQSRWGGRRKGRCALAKCLRQYSPSAASRRRCRRPHRPRCR